MPATLPDGYTWRRATPVDAEAIHALVSRCNIEVIGYPDSVLEDIRNELDEPGFAPETDTWLAHEPGGALAGYGWTFGEGTGEEVNVEVITTDDGVVHWLYDRVEARAAELARAGGHGTYTIDKTVHRGDARMRAALAERGYAVVTVFNRMRVDHDGAAPADPAPPAGVTVHYGPGDEDFRRTAHAVLTESFTEHIGLRKPFDKWQQALEHDSKVDWSGLALASLDGQPVAAMLTTDRYAKKENCGHVADIGVLKPARGRGIAKYLLRLAFAADIRAGRTGTMLTVDTNNVTPALRLYESLGMRPVLVVDLWRRRVSG